MKPRPLSSYIYPIFGIIVLSSLVIYQVFTLTAVKDFSYRQGIEELKKTTILLRNMVGEIGIENPPEVDRFCKTATRDSGIRITVIRTDGTVIGESEKSTESLENHISRPEVQGALSGTVSYSIRRSSTVRKNMLYLALPLESDTGIIGVVRASVPVSEIEALISSTSWKIGFFGIIVFALTIGAGFYSASRITRPLKAIEEAAREYAAGNLSHRLLVDGPEEITTLSLTLSSMAEQLQARMAELRQQKDETRAVLSGMSEAVIVLDMDLTIVDINPAASRILKKPEQDIRNQNLINVFRNTEIVEFVKKLSVSSGPMETTVVLQDYGEADKVLAMQSTYIAGKRYIQIHGAVLQPGAAGAHQSETQFPETVPARIILVLNDVTQIQNLDAVRRDFVANVSHELKTPITTIKGFVETLLDGALDDRQTAERFLSIIEKQSERLIAIIDDLLSLSKLEQSSQREIETEEVPLFSILSGAIEIMTPKAAKKQIPITLTCPETLRAHIHPILIEQAVVNLIDNAVKYSQEGSPVTVTARANDVNIEISVHDEGCGIPAKDMPRIFERFYRVDKARSREMGGTGLGLAIVKHIALVHKGEALVESVEGKGSTFTIRLPIQKT
ncbi:MAG TPA: ATP-binding protein [Spirochaetia bacterium]|nr:ATP-binding protein [Spirochaetia bacterium]